MTTKPDLDWHRESEGQFEIAFVEASGEVHFGRDMFALPDDALRIVVHGEKEDAPSGWWMSVEPEKLGPVRITVQASQPICQESVESGLSPLRGLRVNHYVGCLELQFLRGSTELSTDRLGCSNDYSGPTYLPL
jgi:hypothetical protein